MSVYHVNQIRHRIETTFQGLIDQSDVEGKPEKHRGDAFLSRALAAYALMQEADLTPNSAASQITDGYDDNGLDAIYVHRGDRDSITLYLVQAKWNHDGSASPDLSAAKAFVDGIGDLLEQKWNKFNQKIQSKKDVVNAALLNPQCRVVAILVHTSNQKLGSHPQEEINQFCKTINDPTEFLEFIQLDQGLLFKSLAGNTSTKLDLTVELHEWGKIDEPSVAFYGYVAASQIAQWWEEHQTRLFDKNLRGVLGETSVNKEIALTLEKKPEKFWYFNNGITIIADEINKGALNGSSRTSGLFQCVGASIVNGAQTATTIGRYFQKNPTHQPNAFVHVRLISVKDAPDFDSEVTKANNTQNRIEGRDFAAVDEEQQRLKLELSLYGVNYQLTRTADFVSTPQSFDVEEAVSALACAKADPDLAITAKREMGKFWENTKKPPYTDVVRSGVHAPIVLNAVRTVRQIENHLVSARAATQAARGDSIIVWANKIIASIVFAKLGSKFVEGKPENVEALIAKPVFGDLVMVVANAVVTEVEESYSGYVANTFKNPSKSRAIYAAVAAKIPVAVNIYS